MASAGLCRDRTSADRPESWAEAACRWIGNWANYPARTVPHHPLESACDTTRDRPHEHRAAAAAFLLASSRHLAAQSFPPCRHCVATACADDVDRLAPAFQETTLLPVRQGDREEAVTAPRQARHTALQSPPLSPPIVSNSLSDSPKKLPFSNARSLRLDDGRMRDAL